MLAPKDGSVTIEAKPTVTEKEIFDDRQLIIQRLDAAYLNLVDTMAPFQRKWDADPISALADATWSGASAGVSGWGEDFAEMFEKKTWVALGDKISDAAGSVYDTAGVYAIRMQNDLTARANKAAGVIENADKTLMNWAWWQANYDEAAQSAQAKLAAVQSTVNQTVKTATEAAEKARKIYAHREAILNLPTLIAKGDPKPIQSFVDTVLMDIDPELAKDIKNDPNFYVVLEIIADHDSVLSYLGYASLTFEAVPPNFYAYLAAKGGAYLMIEVILLVVTALLTVGAAAAARITALAARIAASSAKVAGVAKKIERAMEAFNAFTRSIEDFSDAANQLHRLGDKLRQARQRGLRVKGNTRSTITARREAIKRDKKCRICGSSKHTTPRGHIGTVVYE
ncbi:hypothetical protein R0381_002669 [Jeongeupia wiesaeckerbachi]|uniref:hypothetical protein n=1 Tax=Jeongeupia wiesaeckerbachi TaxID=3051218 RepID=UPI003D80690E